MALIKKALMFAITSGLAKKAWDAYRQKSSPGRGRARLNEASRSLKQGDRERPRG